MPRRSKDRPNILYIVGDQWRGECLSLLNHPCVKTPNLDALAAEGTTFTRHYCQTVPCGPSRASMHTGMYLMNHRVCANGTPLDHSLTNIAHEVRTAGYDPMLFGYTDQSADPRVTDPDDPRLRSYEGILPGMSVGTYLPDHLEPWVHWLAEQGVESDGSKKPMYWPGAHDAAEPMPLIPTPRFSAEQTETAFLTERFMDYARGQGDKPWFAHVTYIRPHPPFAVPEPYASMFDPAAMPSPVRRDNVEAEGAQHPALDFLLRMTPKSAFSAAPLTGPSAEWDLEQVAALRAIYYAMIAEVDAQIGRIVAFLKETGQYDNTLILFTSDHGEMLGDHFLFGKNGYFDQSFHIPLIIRDPAARETGGGVVDRFTEAVDIVPTLLDRVGVDIPAQCDGRSVLPFTRGETPAGWRRLAHYENDFRDVVGRGPEAALGILLDQCQLAAIRDEEYKYIHFANQRPLLFDLKRDPGELENRADDPDYAETALTYARRMLDWRMEFNNRTLTGTHLTDQGAVSLGHESRLSAP